MLPFVLQSAASELGAAIGVIGTLNDYINNNSWYIYIFKSNYYMFY